MGHYADYLLWLYRSGRPNRFAQLQNRATAAVYAAGLWPRRVAALDVRGRKSRRVISFPVVITEYDGERYLVSMLGQDVNWVRNVRATDGSAVLRHGRREAVRLVEMPADAKPAILRRYLDVAPGARPHVPVDRRAPRPRRSSRSHPRSRYSGSRHGHCLVSLRQDDRARRAGLGLPCAALALPMAPA